MVVISSLKLSMADWRFSMISADKISGSGKLSRSAKDLSLIQKISRLVLSRLRISSTPNLRQKRFSQKPSYANEPNDVFNPKIFFMPNSALQFNFYFTSFGACTIISVNSVLSEVDTSYVRTTSCSYLLHTSGKNGFDRIFVELSPSPDGSAKRYQCLRIVH